MVNQNLLKKLTLTVSARGYALLCMFKCCKTISFIAFILSSLFFVFVVISLETRFLIYFPGPLSCKECLLNLTHPGPSYNGLVFGVSAIDSVTRSS